MEILDGLAQFGGDIGQHRLEAGKGFAHNGGILHTHPAFRDGVGNELHDAPILFAVEVVELTIPGRDESEHLALDVGRTLGFEFAADVGGDFHDVAHQEVHIGENGDIDVLHHVVAAIAFGHDGIGGVDQAVAQGVDVGDVALDLKLEGDIFHFWVHDIDEKLMS